MTTLFDTMEFNKQVDQYINNAPEAQRKLLQALRALIHSSVPKGTEQFKWSRPVYAASKDICYLVSNKKHVNLGFINFEKIGDPEGLLEGTGKNMRHVKIKSMKDIQKAVLKKMIKEAQKVE